MFFRFKRKLHISLFFSVVFVLTIIFVLTSVYLNRIIRDDFEKRAQSLINQYAGSLSFRLSIADEATNSFRNQYNTDKYFEDGLRISGINSVLPSVKSYNLCISGASVIDKNGSVFFSDSGHNESFLTNALSKDITSWLSTAPEQTVFKLYSFSKKNGILCIKPIISKEENHGYFVTDIMIKKLLLEYNFNDNLFICQSTITLTDGNAEITVYDSLTKENKERSYKVPPVRIGDTGLSLECNIYPEYSIAKQRTFILILFTAFLFFIIICIFTMRLLTNKIAQPLDSLYKEMNEYIQSIKLANLKIRSESNVTDLDS